MRIWYGSGTRLTFAVVTIGWLATITAAVVTWLQKTGGQTTAATGVTVVLLLASTAATLKLVKDLRDAIRA